MGHAAMKERVEKAPGLRERKAAQTRRLLAKSLADRLAEDELDDISVDDLAADANVSRVTFFNYFAVKRDAIDYLMVSWLFEIQADMHRGELRGVSAIERIFEHMGSEASAAPGRMRRMYGHFCVRPPAGRVIALTRADQELLAPDIAYGSFEILGLGHLFQRLAEEAREDGLELVGSGFELSHYLGSLLNGMVLTGHTGGQTDFKQLARRHVRRALGLLGAEGQRDPRPPRIPDRYKTKTKKARRG